MEIGDLIRKRDSPDHDMKIGIILEIREIVHNIDEHPLLSYKIIWNGNTPMSWAISSQIEVLK